MTHKRSELDQMMIARAEAFVESDEGKRQIKESQEECRRQSEQLEKASRLEWWKKLIPFNI